MKSSSPTARSRTSAASPLQSFSSCIILCCVLTMKAIQGFPGANMAGLSLLSQTIGNSVYSRGVYLCVYTRLHTERRSRGEILFSIELPSLFIHLARIYIIRRRYYIMTADIGFFFLPSPSGFLLLQVAVVFIILYKIYVLRLSCCIRE